MSKLGKSILKGAAEALAYTRKVNIKLKVHKVTVPEQISVKVKKEKRR